MRLEAKKKAKKGDEGPSNVNGDGNERGLLDMATNEGPEANEDHSGCMGNEGGGGDVELIEGNKGDCGGMGDVVTNDGPGGKQNKDDDFYSANGEGSDKDGVSVDKSDDGGEAERGGKANEGGGEADGGGKANGGGEELSDNNSILKKIMSLSFCNVQNSSDHESGAASKLQSKIQQSDRLTGTKRRRRRKPSTTVRNQDFDVEVVPRMHPKMKVKLVEWLTIAGAIVLDELQLDYASKTQEDLILLRCGDAMATLSYCYSVVSPLCGGVEEDYRAV